jgi:hypothetical protein
MQKTSRTAQFGTASLRLATAVSLALGLVSAANAAQTVEPFAAATGGSSLNGTTVTVPAGSQLVFYGRYVASASESGLGLKVKYDGTKLTNATITEEYDGCRIAAAQVQNPTTATAQAVMGWIDTSIRAAGAVGWPDQAEPAAPSGCLDPGNINGTPTGAFSGLKLFKFTATTAAGFTSGTTPVSLESDGNYSYATATPSFANKSFNVGVGAALGCNLDMDGNGSRQALIDGVLIVRNMLGITSASMVTGISFSATATRTTPAAIATFYATQNFDIDGSGTKQALVDGVILVRLMLGVPNASLLTGVSFPATATRTSAAAIRSYVNTACGTTF